MLKTIRNYYLKELVNPNNSHDLEGYRISQRIENLRKIFLDMFQWNSSDQVVFVPNPYYAKKLALSFFLNSENSGDFVFFGNNVDEDAKIFESEGVNLKYASDSEAADYFEGEKLVYFASVAADLTNAPMDSKYLDVFKVMPKLGGSYEFWTKEPGKYLIVEMMNDDDPVDMADMFIFTPLAGVTVLGFREGIKLNPIILGAASVSFADRQTYNIKDNFRNLESGTLNVPLLLGIEKFYSDKLKESPKK